MEHKHGEPKGSPYDHNAPVVCEACKAELKEALIENFEMFCNKYGTEFDIRKIADLLAKYEVNND